jgi:biopolymer transport protein ExbB
MYQIYNFLFVKGGPVMYPIVLGSILALALFLERIWSLRRERVTPSAFRHRIRALVKNGKLSEAEELCRQNGSALATLVGAALREAGKPRDAVKEAVSEVGRREVSHMDRYVDLLGTIAAVEPLMGLLGTVMGLIVAFQRVEALAGQGQGVAPGELAAGIWVAMITTAAGLIVAIPAYVGYRYLQARVNGLVIDLEEDSLEFAELLSSDGKAMADAKARQAQSDALPAKPNAEDGAKAKGEKSEQRERDEKPSEEGAESGTPAPVEES